MKEAIFSRPDHGSTAYWPWPCIHATENSRYHVDDGEDFESSGRPWQVVGGCLFRALFRGLIQPRKRFSADLEGDEWHSTTKMRLLQLEEWY